MKGMHMPRTLAEKLWDAHVIRREQEKVGFSSPDLLYIDMHLVHEVSSPQAFEGGASSRNG